MWNTNHRARGNTFENKQRCTSALLLLLFGKQASIEIQVWDQQGEREVRGLCGK